MTNVIGSFGTTTVILDKQVTTLVSEKPSVTVINDTRVGPQGPPGPPGPQGDSSSLSWREPVLVADFVTKVLPTRTPGNSILIDNVSVGNNGRVLFADVSDPNVYIYNINTGTFSEDIKNSNPGDVVYVIQGSLAEKLISYTGTVWKVLTDSGTILQRLNGGGASTRYLIDQEIDGGVASTTEFLGLPADCGNASLG